MAFPVVRGFAADVLADFRGPFESERNHVIARAFSFEWGGLFEDYVRMFDGYDREAAELEGRCAGLESDLRTLDQERRCLEGQIAQLSDELSRIQGVLSRTQDELDRTLDSTTFKAGRVVMGVPCAIERFVDDRGRA